MKFKTINIKSLNFYFGILCIFWWAAVAIFWSFFQNEVDHLLWLCDLTLLIAGIGLITGDPLLISSQFVGMFLIQIVWNLDFWPRLIFGIKIIGSSSYMFSPAHPAALKIISLFHIFLPLFLIYGIIKFGYNENGWKLQSILTVAIYILSYITTTETADTNWVLGPFWKRQTVMGPDLYLIFWLSVTLLMYLLFHLFLKYIIFSKGRNK